MQSNNHQNNTILFKSMSKKLFIIALSCAAFISCKEEEKVVPATPLTAVTKTNIYASLPDHYQFFSFATGDTVPASDSATTKWDIGFRSTTIIFNSNVSGPGQAGVIIKNAVFSEVLTADATGYVSDSLTRKAIPTGSGNGWYNYDGATMVISPLAGKVFVVKTATGKFAKFEIFSYYKDAPVTPTAADVSRYYTIRYVYQPDGSTKLN